MNTAPQAKKAVYVNMLRTNSTRRICDSEVFFWVEYSGITGEKPAIVN